MTPAHIAIVWNQAKLDRGELEDALASIEHAGSVSWYQTSEEDPGQGAAAAALEAGADLLVAVGGDGTVRAVVEALAGSDVPLGIVPAGTGNLLARNLGLPLRNVGAALTIALDGSDRRIDVGWATVAARRHAFAVIAGFGIDSRMIAETDDDLKASAGWLAYVTAMGKAIASADVVHVEMTMDEGELTSLDAHTVLIGNCGAVQAGITLLPDAVPDDGELDLLVLSAESALEWADTLKTALWDNGVLRLFRAERPAVESSTTGHLRARRVHLSVEKPVTFEIDGDEIGDVTELSIEIQPAAVAVRVSP